MKKILKRVAVALLAATIITGMVGCSTSKANTEKKEIIKLGSMITTEPIVKKIKEHLISKGYNAETVLFDANNQAAIATKDGDITGFVHNHKPWIDTFNKENNSNITMVEPFIGYYRSALYSTKYKSVDALPKNMVIGIANDPTNIDSGLRFLQNINLIKLGEKKDKFYSKLDIIENPKNITFVESEISTVARTINDVDAIVAAAIRVKQAGIDANSFLKEDETTKSLAVGLSVRAEDANKEWVKVAEEYIKTDEFRTWFDKEYTGTIVQYEKK